MADRYWVGGTATWDGTAGSKWAATSGGPGGETVPTASDDVFFDGGSGAGTVTIGASRVAKSINCTGFTGTLGNSTNAITISGSVTLSAGMTYNHTGEMIFNGTGTLTTAGKTFSAVTVNGSGITLTLGDALDISTRIVTVTLGTLNTANYNVTANQLASNNSNVRTITLGSSTITLSNVTPVVFTTITNLTLNANTSQINCTGTSSTFNGSALTYYNVAFTTTATSTHNINQINVFNNVSVTGPASTGITQLIFNDRQTLNGGLSTSGTTAIRRVWFRSNTGFSGILAVTIAALGSQTLTINGAGSLTDADFRGLYIIGSAAPISGTRLGNRTNCRGITFSSPKTVYWNLAGAQNHTATGWATTSGGTPNADNFPLPQDTCVFNEAGSVTGTITIDSAIPYVGTVDMSARTSAMTISLANPTAIYGSWINGSGTTIANAGSFAFIGDGTNSITTAGKSMLRNFVFSAWGGTYNLNDAVSCGGFHADRKSVV
jgi:hypothetical protein